MPVKVAMNSAIGTESTPSRRICGTTCGAQVRTSPAARAVATAISPKRVTNCASRPGCTADGEVTGLR